MNEIDKKQVETRMLNLLRARTLIYRRAKNVQAVGLIISLVFPIVGLIVSALAPCAAQERREAAGGFRLHGVADGLEQLPRRQSN